MIRVLIDGDVYGRQVHGGVGRSFTETIERIARQAEDIEFLVELPETVKGRYPTGPRITCLPPTVALPSPRGLSARLRDRLRRPRPAPESPRPDIYHSTYYTPNPGIAGKTVVTVHDFIDENSFVTMSGNPSHFIEHKRKICEEADMLVAVSEATRRDVISFTSVPPEKVRVIHHGADTFFQSFDPDSSTVAKFHARMGGRGPYWLFVGRRLRYKNFNTVLRAWARFEELTRMGSRLVAIGPEQPLEECQIDFLISNRLERRFVLLANVDDETLAMGYSRSLGFVFPSLFEGFGIPLLEAMASGTPVLASDIPVFHEVAGEAASYFDPHDTEALARQMIILTDSSARRLFVEKGRKRVRAFSWDRAARELADVYRSVVES